MVQPTWNNFWELPGDGIDKDETLQAVVLRECYEETGYRIVLEDQLYYVADRNFCNTNRGGERYFKSIILIYRWKLVSEERHTELLNQEMNEITKVAWVDVATLTKTNTQPVIWPAIQLFVKMNGC